MDGSDHFAAWMTLYGAGIALVTSVITSLLASRSEDRRDAARREHADRTEKAKMEHEGAVRFHDERLTAYVEYASVATRLGARAATWVSRGAVGSLTESANAYFNSYIDAMARVQMLAKPPLVEKVNKLHGFAAKLADESLAPELITAAGNGLMAAVGDFQVAAREELGIE